MQPAAGRPADQAITLALHRGWIGAYSPSQGSVQFCGHEALQAARALLAYQRQTQKLHRLAPRPAMHNNLVQDGITGATCHPKTAALTQADRVHWISGMPTALLWQVDLTP